MKDKFRKLFTNVWTVPNILTMLRLLLIPVFVVLFSRGCRIAALCVFIAASLTDCLDGYLARRLNQITDFGKLFDPLADKLMVLTAMIAQGIAGVFPWFAIAIVAGKELLMVAGGAYMLKQGIVVYSNIVGKSAQVCFIVSLVLSFFHDDFTRLGVQADIILLYITVALALTAMVVYIVGGVRKLKAQDAG